MGRTFSNKFFPLSWTYATYFVFFLFQPVLIKVKYVKSKFACSHTESISSLFYRLDDIILIINDYEYFYCTGLTSVCVNWKSPLEIDFSTFEEIDNATCTLYVPQGTKDNYRLSSWGDFENIVEYDVTRVDNVSMSNDVKETARYGADGQRLEAPVKGLNIVRYSDGSVRKIAVQ